MVDLERWKNEIIESITDLHDETKKIRKYLEDEQNEKDEQDEQDVQDEEDVQDEQDQEEEHEEQETNEDEELSGLNNVDEIGANEVVIIEKLDELNESLNLLNKTVVEGSLVVSISIVIALAFHYFVNQISKW